MTTGRINQVANPSSTRGEQTFGPGEPTPRVGPGTLGKRTLGRGFPAELQRSAAARRGAGSGFPDRRGLGGAPGGARSDVVGRLGPGTLPSALQRGRRGGAGTRGPVAHPFGTRSCEPTRSGEGPFRLGFGLGRGPVAWSGPYDALGIEFPTDRGPFGR